MKLKHNIALLVGVLITLSPHKVSAVDAISPDAVAAIKKLCATYSAAHSDSCKISVKLSIDQDNKTEEEERDYFLVTEKPNKYSVQFHSKVGGAAVSDGKTVEYFLPKGNLYMTDTAPASIEEGMSTEEFDIVTGAALIKSLFSQLLGSAPYDELMQDVSRASLAANETIDGVSCKHVVLTKAEHAEDIWISADKTAKIQKVRFALAKAPSQSKSNITYLYQNQLLNIAVDPGKFAPPHDASAKKVASFVNDPHKALLGKLAPDVILKLDNGTALKLRNLKDRVVVLDFWATWCGPCVMSMPVYARESESFKDRGVVFIPVNQGEGKEAAMAFMKKEKLPMHCALDDGKLGEVFHTEAIPETVFIGKDGTVKGVHVGISQDFKDRFVQDLNAVLEGKRLAAH